MAQIIHYTVADSMAPQRGSDQLRSVVVPDGFNSNKSAAATGWKILRYIENQYFEFDYRPPVIPIGALREEDNWGALYLNAKLLAEHGATGLGIKVGLIDFGIDLRPDCFHSLKLMKFAEIDKDFGSIKEMEPYDAQWHGTFCGAILAGAKTHGYFRGLAPDVELYVAKVFDQRFGSSYVAIHQAIQFCIDNNVKIISLSLGAPNLVDVWAPIIKQFLDSGGIMFAGIGNDYTGAGPTISPANYPFDGIVAVGAHDEKEGVWAKSGGGEVSWRAGSFGDNVVRTLKPDIVGPGVGIESVRSDGEIDISEGTSFATPHLSALAACLWSKFPHYVGHDIIKALFDCCRDRGGVGHDARYGRGVVDSQALIYLLRAG